MKTARRIAHRFFHRHSWSDGIYVSRCRHCPSIRLIQRYRTDEFGDPGGMLT